MNEKRHWCTRSNGNFVTNRSSTTMPRAIQHRCVCHGRVWAVCNATNGASWRLLSPLSWVTGETEHVNSISHGVNNIGYQLNMPLSCYTLTTTLTSGHGDRELAEALASSARNYDNLCSDWGGAAYCGLNSGIWCGWTFMWGKKTVLLQIMLPSLK